MDKGIEKLQEVQKFLKKAVLTFLANDRTAFLLHPYKKLVKLFFLTLYASSMALPISLLQ